MADLGYIIGNGAITIGYTANGEASDWMLNELGIYAMSPELGLSSAGIHANKFFISFADTLKSVVTQNLSWIRHAMRFLVESVECEHVGSRVIDVTQTKSGKLLSTVKSVISCHNHGLSLASNSTLIIEPASNDLNVLFFVADIDVGSGDESKISMDCQHFSTCHVSLFDIEAESARNFTMLFQVDSDILEYDRFSHDEDVI